jgi:hypothetical protein
MKTLILVFLIIFSAFRANSQCGTTILVSDQSICSGDFLNISFSTDFGNYNFGWTNDNSSTGIPAFGSGSTLNSITNNPGVSTILIEAVDPLNNCPTLYDTITITVRVTPTLISSPDLSACANTFVNVNPFSSTPANPSTNYVWSSTNISIGLAPTGFGNIDSFLVFNTANFCQITDIVVYAFLDGCASMPDTFSITVCPEPIVFPTPDFSNCANEEITVSPFACTVTNSTFLWALDNISIGLPSSGSGDIGTFTSTNSTTICQTANIVLTATANGCSSYADTFSITVCPEPSISLISDTSICLGNQITLAATGNPSGGFFLWNTQETTDSITVSPISSALFSVSYQTINGCSITDSVSVGIATLDNLNLTDTIVCQGETVVLSAGSNSVSCDLAEPICSNTSLNFPNLTNTTAPVGNNYDCLGTQPNPSWFYVQIEQPGDLTLDIIQTSNFGGSGLDVDFILYGPYSSYAEATTYCGNLGAATSGSGLNTVVDCSYSTSSTETVNLFGTQTGQVYVMMLTNFANEPGSYTITQTIGSASLDCSILSNNTSPTTYLWSNGETTPWITVIPSNTNMYTVTVTSSGCEFIDSSLITVNPTPTVSANNATISSGQSATLTAVGTPSGGSFLWDPTGQTTSSITVSPTTTTDYLVTYTFNGCSSETTATVDLTAGITNQTNYVISIYPNPAQSILTLRVDEKIIGNFYVIIDSQGRILKRETIESTIQDIAISDFRNGLYTIQIGSSNFKFIKN